MILPFSGKHIEEAVWEGSLFLFNSTRFGVVVQPQEPNPQLHSTVYTQIFSTFKNTENRIADENSDR